MENMTQKQLAIAGLVQAIDRTWGFEDTIPLKLATALVESDAFRDWIADRLLATWGAAELDEREQADAILGRESHPSPSLEIVR